MDRVLCVIRSRGRKLLDLRNSWKHARWASSSQTGSLRRLRQYLKDQPEAVQKLNREFAMPYVNLDTLFEDLDENYPHKPSENILYNAAKKAQLHWPAINMEFLLSNIEKVEENMKNRKLPGVEIDIRKDIIAPYRNLQRLREETKRCEEDKYHLTLSMTEFWKSHPEGQMHNLPVEIEEKRQKIADLRCYITLLEWIETVVKRVFYEKALLLPNMTHHSVPVGNESECVTLRVIGEKPKPDYNAMGHMEVANKTMTIRQANISPVSGQRTYYLCNEVAVLEQALVRYTLDKLKSKNFAMISCPNILHGSVFEGCGVASTKIGDMLYKIDPSCESDYYIAGTSEAGIAAYFASHAVNLEDLPIKLCCISTCNRKESDNRRDPRGLYRVHHFTKVEMFGLTANETGDESNNLLEEFTSVQEELFTELGLHFRIVNMPSGDLGLPAHQKIDMEAWMSGRNDYGEISSASNCTDFQSRRLHILYKEGKRKYKFAHTVNGTACAVPRLIIALMENNQTKDMSIDLPPVLEPYMGMSTLKKSKNWNLQYIGPNQARNKWRTPK